jgi:hypothetical protein
MESMPRVVKKGFATVICTIDDAGAVLENFTPMMV